MSNRIIGADWCPYCIKVKDYFDSKGVKYEWVDSESAEGGKVRDEESKKYNYKTIPMVYVGGKFIGGCDNFFAKNGREFNLWVIVNQYIFTLSSSSVLICWCKISELIDIIYF